MAKRRNETREESQVLLKENWVTVFHFIADHRLLPMKAVSRDWCEWIVREGLEEIPDMEKDFLAEMKNLSQYKSLTAATIQTQCLKKENFHQNLVESFSRLKIATILERVIESEDFYLEALGYMTNLESLNLVVMNQSIPSDTLQKLTNLRNLSCVLLSFMNYSWLSDMTQLKTLSLTFQSEPGSRMSHMEAQLIGQSLRNLTQLETLRLVNPLTDFRFMEKMGSLENFILVQYDRLGSYENLSHLTNLRHINLPSVPSFVSVNFFTNMKQLECLHFPGLPVPDDFKILQEKLPKLKHLTLLPNFDHFIRNSKPLMRALQVHSKPLDVSFAFSGTPPYVDVDDSYYQLLCHMKTNGVNFVDGCPHCRDECNYHYLSPVTRRIFRRK